MSTPRDPPARPRPAGVHSGQIIFRTSPQAEEDIAEAYVAGVVRFGVSQAGRFPSVSHARSPDN